MRVYNQVSPHAEEQQPFLSFCIPVYNQIELVSQCLDALTVYPGHEIEIIVNDDNSSENIADLVKSKNDNRIKYFKNARNLGHDLNIIASFRNAIGKYAFLLRTRDRVVPDMIPLIIGKLCANPKAVYLTGSAINENSVAKLKFRNKTVRCGKQAFRVNNQLFVHPSGSVFRISSLMLDQLEQTILLKMPSKLSFVAHTMMRVQLAQEGDFELMSENIWVYTDTHNAADVAVNVARNRTNVYLPSLSRERYKCEFAWADSVVKQPYRVSAMKGLFSRYLEVCTWSFRRRNRNSNLQRHYAYDAVAFSLIGEQAKIIRLAFSLNLGSSLKTNQKLRVLLYICGRSVYNVTLAPVMMAYRETIANLIVWSRKRFPSQFEILKKILRRT